MKAADVILRKLSMVDFAPPSPTVSECTTTSVANVFPSGTESEPDPDRRPAFPRVHERAAGNLMHAYEMVLTLIVSLTTGS